MFNMGGDDEPVRWSVWLVLLAALLAVALVVVTRHRDAGAPGDAGTGVDGAPSVNRGESSSPGETPLAGAERVVTGADIVPGSPDGADGPPFEQLERADQDRIAAQALRRLADSLTDVKAPEILGEQPPIIDASPAR